MTKKDYIRIAEALRAAMPDDSSSKTYKAELARWDITALHLLHALHSDNPRFDRDRFATACGLKR